MRPYLITSIRVSAVMLLICCVFYFSIVTLIAKAAPGSGAGETVMVNNRKVGYLLIGQKFSEDKYFHGRPSAVDYNGSGSGGSNKSTTNADYIKTVEDRIDSFLVHNPAIKRREIPADLVTASGSGLDPDISPQAANVQLPRIARTRNVPETKLKALLDGKIQHGWLGPDKVNVLMLNVALDNLK